MDDLLEEFLTETAESLEVIDAELVAFESNPTNRATLDNIFRLVHTIKGTCGFLGLPRLEAVAHAGETLLGRFRDGETPVTAEAVTIVLESIDCIKGLLGHLGQHGSEPPGEDTALIKRLEAAAEGELGAGPAPAPADSQDADSQDADAAPSAAPAPQAATEPADGTDAEASAAEDAAFDHDLGRSLRPGEVSLADLEAAFQSAKPNDAAEASAPAAPASGSGAAAGAVAEPDDGGGAREGGLGAQSIRVSVDVLENLMTMVSELVLTRNQLLQMVRNSDQSEFKVPLQRLSNITAELQDGVMQTRMQPIGNAWKKLPRIVRDISNDLGKKIKLVMDGEDTELDRQVLDLIKDPLTHMVRNSCDHGIEDPQTRHMIGKPDAGLLRLSAFHEGGHIIIQIADDGAGLNTDRIRRKALEKGLITPQDAEQYTEGQIHRLIFAPGFSTASAVTNISGRGVGMDVVRTNIEQIGGAVDLHSVEGRGTTFTIKIPLTLAIISALIVAVEGHRFAIPQLSVLELVRVGGRSQHRVDSINATQVLRLRDRLLPLVSLGRILGLREEEERDGSGFVVVMRVGGQNFGVVVDDVFDTEEIVVKPLASALRAMTQFSGNTILGDGSVIMIMDPNGLAQAVSHRQDEIEREDSPEESRIARDQQTRSMLLFRAGGEEPKAVPLSLITRLEEVPVANIERGGGGLIVQYRGKLMPLIQADPYGELKADGVQPILVFTDRDRSAGLIVDEILDVAEEAVEIEMGGHAPGVAGTAVLRGKATQVIDIGYYLTQARADWFHTEERPSSEPARPRLLLVDESAFYRNVMEPILVAAGYDVAGVASVEEAWRFNEAGEDFDIIVSDLDLTDSDGTAFAERLAADERWGDIPRVALSSAAAHAVSSQARAAFAQLIPKSERESVVAALETVIAAAEEAA